MKFVVLLGILIGASGSYANQGASNTLIYCKDGSQILVNGGQYVVVTRSNYDGAVIYDSPYVKENATEYWGRARRCVNDD